MPRYRLEVRRHHTLVSVALPLGPAIYLTDDEARDLATALTAALTAPATGRHVTLDRSLPGACLSAARNTRPSDF